MSRSPSPSPAVVTAPDVQDCPHPWAEKLMPVSDITKLWVCKNPPEIYKRRADMMVNLGISTFKKKVGYGNAMAMELKDFENLEEMLEMANIFMEQTEEPEGKAGDVKKWMKNQNAAVRLLVVLVFGTMLGWMVFQCINYAYEALDCKAYFGNFDIFCGAFDKARIFVKEWKREFEMLIVAETLALLAIPFSFIANLL